MRIDAIDPDEQVVITFDFAAALDAGETLSGLITTSVATVLGSDATPAAILNGVATYDSTSTRVLLPVKGGLLDRDYVINVLKASPSFWSAGKLELAIGTNTVRPDLFEFTFFGKQGTFFCAPLDFLNDKFIDERVVAIIGNDLLRQWRAIINTHKQTLTIHE